jgi:hypothetical protein
MSRQAKHVKYARERVKSMKETTMATNKKKTEPRERASVSRERRLALALRAVLDAWSTVGINDDVLKEVERTAVEEAETAANELLNEFGYSKLESIPARLQRLNVELKVAVEAGDGDEIARLGKELSRAKAGKEPLSVPKPSPKSVAAAGEKQ